MILTALNDYYERLRATGESGISAPGYSMEKISYALVLDAAGGLVAVDDLRELSGKKPAPKIMSVPQPEKRTAGIRANRLWDKTSYALGVSASSKRAEEEHAAFKTLHLKLLADSEDPGLRALAAFLTIWTPAMFGDNPHFSPDMLDANVVFRFDGERGYLHDRPAARALLQRSDGTEEASRMGLCLVTGQRLPLARLHPAIKGVNGAQSSGASIVSFNLDAFKSYGKDQGENAPISEQAAFGYTTALNHLLRRDPENRQRLQIGDATVVFWATAADDDRTQAAELLFDLLMDPPSDGAETERLRNVLDQVRALEARPDLDSGLAPGTRMHVLGLAPNASRLSIRFWLTDDMRRFAERLGDHYRDIGLQPAPWKTPPALWQLLLATAPSREGKAKSEDVPPQLAGEMTRAILAGTAYPHSLLDTLVMRMRADQKVDQRTVGIRAALCRAVLARRSRLYSHDRSPPVSLDTANTERGYVLGRLFSLLENAQRAALGDKLNATIRDRYYGAASATPANVFPVLLRNAQHHLSRLRKDKPGLAVTIEKDIGETIALLDGFPRSLRIEAQGQFAIGYYHQTQARFARGDAPDQDDHEDNGEE
jgi:CRISPR-associated protein Csd1